MNDPELQAFHRTKWRARGFAAALFFSGAAIGGGLAGLYAKHVVQRALLRNPDLVAASLVYSLSQELELDSHQQAVTRKALESAMRDMRIMTIPDRPKSWPSWERAQEQIRAVLSAEQARKLEQKNVQFLRAARVNPFSKMFRELNLSISQLKDADAVLAERYPQTLAAVGDISRVPDQLLLDALPAIRTLLTDEQRNRLDQIAKQYPQLGAAGHPSLPSR